MQKLAFCLGLFFSLPITGIAQQTPSRWGAQVSYAYEALSGRRAPWQISSAMLQRHFAKTTLLAELASVQRFQRRDLAFALEGWSALWPQAYGNLRLQYAPSPNFSPTYEPYLELYQGMGAWEVAVALRYRHFSDQEVTTWGLATGRYLGNWYLRTQALVTIVTGHFNWTQRILARRYGASPASFVEVQAGYGRGVEIVDTGPVLKQLRTYFVTCRAQHFLTQTVGVMIGLSYSNDDLFTRRGAVLGLLTRW